mmetsp:Transcript_3484/g.6635  ORF Transcript_3484/g.6635 Transcript_3484/m.6635 type:complete len:330 (-) Transcript_3484:197-1186(-)
MLHAPKGNDRVKFPDEGTTNTSTTSSTADKGIGVEPCMVDDEPPRADTTVCVRNTFIDVESGSPCGLQTVNMHDGGAQTWAVSAFGLGSVGLGSNWRSDQDDSTPLPGDSPTGISMEEPSVVIVTPDQSLTCADVRDPEGCRHNEAQRAQTSTSPASAAMPDQPSDANGTSAPAPTPSSAEPGLVLLQVPLQLHCGSETSLFRGALDTNVAVIQQELDPETGALSLKLQVTLKPPAKSGGTSSQNVRPQPWLQQPMAKAAPQQQRRPSPTPGAVAAEKRDGICCHWKNGWCKFGGSCKFMHPLEMCGIASKSDNAAGVGTYMTPESVRY